MKVALLSNVNADYILRMLARKYDMVPPVGYGDVWGKLLNPSSELNKANPDVIVILIHVEQMLDGCTEESRAEEIIEEWFLTLDNVVRSDKDYFISDISFRFYLPATNDSLFEYHVERAWLERLSQRMEKNVNVHILKIQPCVEILGKRVFFSDKLWYMGKIPYSNEGCRIIAETIDKALVLLSHTSKKVLVLDLDNTLWGGILGEDGIAGILLSDDHIGGIYKRVQQMIKAIKDSGVLLAIDSKNNEFDVQEIWDKHPHMILRREDFSAIKINWDDKTDNICSIAKMLNLGLDSFVFIDDTPAERDNIHKRLPEVTVPDFPARIEEYPEFISEVFEHYFKRIRMTEEDRTKTRQYVENALRDEIAKGMTYEKFLQSLNLKVERVSIDDSKLERIVQLHGKTNQFNLTTMRYTRAEIEKMIAGQYSIYAYRVSDKFGDYGLVAVIIVDLEKVEICSFLMSCRIMGKQIEDYVIDDVESDLLKRGYKTLYAKYIKTKKNTPVAYLYDKLGYSIIRSDEAETDYSLDLTNKPHRKHYVTTI